MTAPDVDADERTRILPVVDQLLPPTRRWPRRVVMAVIAVLIVMIIAVVGAYFYVRGKLNEIPRIAVSNLDPAGATAPQNILVAGSDSRANESAAAAQHFGTATDVSGQRSDSIVLIHLEPGTGQGALLSIPRDMFVPIAGTASSNRINVAFNSSPGQLVATIKQAFGITVNHYVQEDFAGLQGLTDAVGGVCMNFPMPVRDSSPTGTGSETGLSIQAAGPHVLNGDEGLAFVRSRYYQYFQNGKWHPEGTGDIGRIARQHEFVRALAGRMVHSARNPFRGAKVLGKAVKTVTVDSTFSTSDMMRLGIKLRSFKPGNVPSFTLPYKAVIGFRGFGDVLLPVPDQDAQVIAAWSNYGASGSQQAATTTSAPAPVSKAPSANRRATPTTTAPAAPGTETRPPWDPTAC